MDMNKFKRMAIHGTLFRFKIHILPADHIINSDGILNFDKFPKRLMIIGAGISGCEYATIFSNFRQTKVYLVDRETQIIPFEDEDISRFVSNNLEQNNVEIFHSAGLKRIIKHKQHLAYYR